MSGGHTLFSGLIDNLASYHEGCRQIQFCYKFQTFFDVIIMILY